MQTILIVLHLLLAIGLVGLVLMQHGKGADAGAAFGSGASATVFGARGSANFLSRATAILAGLFFITSLALAYFAMQSSEQPGLMEIEAPAAGETQSVEVPVVEEPAAPTDLPTAPAAPPAAGTDMPQVQAPAETQGTQ